MSCHTQMATALSATVRVSTPHATRSAMRRRCALRARNATKKHDAVSKRVHSTNASHAAHRRRACTTSDSGGSGVLVAALSAPHSGLEASSGASSNEHAGATLDDGDDVDGGPGASGSALAPSAVTAGAVRSEDSVTMEACARMSGSVTHAEEKRASAAAMRFQFVCRAPARASRAAAAPAPPSLRRASDAPRAGSSSGCESASAPTREAAAMCFS